MKTILINASAAKTGGAETIIRTFVDVLGSFPEHRYVIISPISFCKTNPNMKFVRIKTSGVFTVLFSTIGIFIFQLLYRPYKIISFNNLNSIFTPKKGITYFHQPKALNPKYRSLKIKTYDYFITHFLKSNKFILQSSYTKNLFQKKYKISRDNLITCWPGFTIPSNIVFNKGPKLKHNDNYNRIGVFPVNYTAEHKNIKLLVELTCFFRDNNISIITLLENGNYIIKENDVFQNIGAVSRLELYYLYSIADFLIFTSYDETVGLPIFEFLQFGKPAFIFNAQYAQSFIKQFNFPKNFILFDDAESFSLAFEQNITVLDQSVDYSKGEWNKIIDLL